MVARESLESREILKTVPFHVLAYLHKENMSRDKAALLLRAGQCRGAYAQDSASSMEMEVELM